MRVLYFHQHFSTPGGAVGTRSYEMARRLVARGHQVTMVCGSYANARTGLDDPFVGGRRRGMVEGIDVLELKLAYGNKDGFAKRSWTFLRFALSSIGVALREPADLVFATSTPLTAAIPGIAARLLRRLPFVFEVRDLWPELPRQMGVIRNPAILWALSALEWVSYRTADRLIALSPGIRDGIARRGVAMENIALIPNGSDIELFSTPATRLAPDGVGENDFVAIFSGTHGPANGLRGVLDAASILKRRGTTGIILLLVGDGKEKLGLQRQVVDDGLKDIVVMLPPMPKRELVNLMDRADAGMQILANIPGFYYGTSPNKFFDYLAAGLPVLTNYPGWVADLVEEFDCGVAVPPDDPEAFADALTALAQRKDRNKMGERSRRLARARFDRNALGEAFVAWLEKAESEVR